MPYNGSRLPIGTTAADCYRDKDSADGVFTAAEKEGLIVRADACTDSLGAAAAVVGSPSNGGGNATHPASQIAAIPCRRLTEK